MLSGLYQQFDVNISDNPVRPFKSDEENGEETVERLEIATSDWANTQTTNYSARSSPAEQPPLSSPQISHILHNRDGMKQEFNFLLVEINWVFLITRFIRSSQIPKHRPEYLTIFNILYEPLWILHTLRSFFYLLKI